MPTTANETTLGVAAVTGVPHATIRQIHRRLVETAAWPSARGAYVPVLTTYHLVLLLFAYLADVPNKDCVSAAYSYFALTDENGNKLGDVLVSILDSFKSANGVAALALQSRLEVDCGQPRACIISNTLEGSVETLYGLSSKQWDDVTVRRSMTISGKVLFDLAMGLHFNRWNEDKGGL